MAVRKRGDAARPELPKNECVTVDSQEKADDYGVGRLYRNLVEGAATVFAGAVAERPPGGDMDLRRERAIAALVAEGATLLDDGDSIAVAVGVERFDGFDVGPVEVLVRKRPGEDLAKAYRRARDAAALMFEVELAERHVDHAVMKGKS